MDKLTKEMADLLTSNQDLEDKTRRQEGELKDLRRVKSDLEKANHGQLLQIQQVRQGEPIGCFCVSTHDTCTSETTYRAVKLTGVVYAVMH